MDPTLVSVIIPTHNRQAYLPAAVASVLAQTHRHFELIVIDDGSTDSTAAVMRTLCHPQLLYHQVNNRGAAAARNLGLQLARGGLIAFLDSDDLWEPDKLREQVAVFDTQPALGMLASNFRYIDGTGVPVCDPAKPSGYRIIDFIGDILASQFPMATSSMMIRRAVFDQVGVFNETLRIAEDLDLWLRIGLRWPVAYLDRVLASVRLHAHHMMRETPRHHVWLDSAAVIASHRAALLPRYPALDSHLARMLAQAGNIALLDGQRRAAAGAYRQAWQLAPASWRSLKNLLRCLLPLAYLRQRYARHVDPARHPIMQLYR